MRKDETENYFKKNGRIYGLSEKFNFGRWEGYVVVFSDYDDAWEWLETEEYDFRTRELVTLEEARENLIAYDKQYIEEEIDYDEVDYIITNYSTGEDEVI